MVRQPNVVVRMVRTGDGPRLFELFKSIASPAFHPHPFTLTEAEHIATCTGPDVYAVLVADHEFVAYGLLRGWEEGYAVPSLGIAVRADRRSQGYGRLMMGWLSAEAARRGASSIRLRVDSANSQARRLYESLGYRYAGEERGELLMLLDLGILGTEQG